MLYRFDRVRKAYGPKDVLKDVTWQHNSGEKVGLVGRNGAGKTTLLRLVLGIEEPDAGEVVRANTVRIAAVEQMAPIDLAESLHDFTAGAFSPADRVAAGQVRVAEAPVDLEEEKVELVAAHDAPHAGGQRLDGSRPGIPAPPRRCEGSRKATGRPTGCSSDSVGCTM